MKRVAIGAKPFSRPINADDWVQARERASEPVKPPIERMKRLTVDVSLSLHGRIKSKCALQNLQMADVIRDLLEQHFPA